MPVYRIYSAPSPFNAAELAALDTEQTADILYLAHQNHAPSKMLRYGHYDWRFADVTFGPTISAPTSIGVVATKPNQDQANTGNAWFPQDASYVVTAFSEDTGQESRASAQVTASNDLGLKRNYSTITWAAVAGATGYRVYKGENTQTHGYIGTTTSTTFRDDNIGPDLSEGPPIGDNPFLMAGDYPGSITFHEQRSYWARTPNRPNAVYASRSADYENMDYTRPSRADDAFVIGLVANKVNSVNQMHSMKQGLLALTSHNLFSIQGSNEDYISAVPPPRVRPEVKRGASTLRPLGIDSTVLYETAKSAEIRALGYEFEVDGIRSNDISLFSRHLFQDHTIIDWDYAEKPGSLVVAVRDDGKINALTWDAEQQVWGWTVWESDGLFKGVCSITEQDEDRIYLLVERVINGQTLLYVERMASELWETQGIAHACYLDCARTFENLVATAYFDRLDHLEGKTVVAFVDGAKVAKAANGSPLVVTAGAVTLPVGGLVVTIGLPFTATVETLPLAVQTNAGWSVARPQDISRVVLRVIESSSIMAGTSASTLYPVKQRHGADYDAMDLFTGDLKIDLPGASGDEAVVVIQSSDPTPMHIAALLVEVSLGDMS